LLIDAAFASAPRTAEPFRAWLAAALQAGAQRVGVSARGEQVRAWHERGEAADRAVLATDWAEVLAEAVVPLPAATPHVPLHWPAILQTDAGVWRAHCHWLAGGHGNLEWTADIAHRIEPDPRVVEIDTTLRRALETRAGQATVLAATADADIGGEVLGLALPLLPTHLRGAPARSIHLDAPGSLALPGVLGQPVEAEAGIAAVAAMLAAFRPDALTLGIAGVSAASLAACVQVAPLLVVPGADGLPPVDLSARLVRRGPLLVWTLS
jgi:hypothetical protein